MESLVNLDELGIFTLILCVLWLYLPGYLVNTFAMMWGKWLPKRVRAHPRQQQVLLGPRHLSCCALKGMAQ